MEAPSGGDEFFSAAQIARLAELMARWRSARVAGVLLPNSEQSELDDLIKTELKAATSRAAALLVAHSSAVPIEPNS